ncbi:hypothetical protein VP01_1393g2 [Puccinia sorghi]|uniref:Uncharacterized protein n=1 Tax=Puccinia sorghi TaxID=27349 RepID=A0A0L6VMZ7_9BASI|nr:hypothetical protein VP01_1393g2 [Puccinia sorghi]
MMEKWIMDEASQALIKQQKAPGTRGLESVLYPYNLLHNTPVWLATKFLFFGRVVLVLLSFCDWGCSLARLLSTFYQSMALRKYNRFYEAYHFINGGIIICRIWSWVAPMTHIMAECYMQHWLTKRLFFLMLNFQIGLFFLETTISHLFVKHRAICLPGECSGRKIQFSVLQTSSITKSTIISPFLLPFLFHATKIAYLQNYPLASHIPWKLKFKCQELSLGNYTTPNVLPKFVQVMLSQSYSITCIYFETQAEVRILNITYRPVPQTEFLKTVFGCFFFVLHNWIIGKNCFQTQKRYYLCLKFTLDFSYLPHKQVWGRCDGVRNSAEPCSCSSSLPADDQAGVLNLLVSLLLYQVFGFQPLTLNFGSEFLKPTVHTKYIVRNGVLLLAFFSFLHILIRDRNVIPALEDLQREIRFHSFDRGRQTERERERETRVKIGVVAVFYSYIHALVSHPSLSKSGTVQPVCANIALVHTRESRFPQPSLTIYPTIAHPNPICRKTVALFSFFFFHFRFGNR